MADDRRWRNVDRGRLLVGRGASPATKITFSGRPPTWSRLDAQESVLGLPTPGGSAAAPEQVSAGWYRIDE
jgi:hypothetical protein